MRKWIGMAVLILAWAGQGIAWEPPASTASGVTAAAVSDSMKAHVATKILLDLTGFQADTARTIGGSDTINVWYDFRGDTAIVAIATDDSAYTRKQNITLVSGWTVPNGVSGVDSVVFHFRTQHATADSNAVRFYLYERSKETMALTLIDSSSNDSSGVAWTKKGFSAGTGLTAGDRLVLMLRAWSKNKQFAYIREPYVVMH